MRFSQNQNGALFCYQNEISISQKQSQNLIILQIFSIIFIERMKKLSLIFSEKIKNGGGLIMSYPN